MREFMNKALFGIGLGNTGWYSGCEKAPSKIHNFLNRYCPDIFNIAKYESISFNPGISTEMKLEMIYQKYSKLYNKYDKILSIGGDHLISYPILKYLCEKKEVTYLYLDAHLDFFNDKPFYNWNIAKRITKLDSKVINIGFRNILDESTNGEVACIPIIEDFNIKNIMEELNSIMSKNNNIYLSIDVDILEPLIFPYINSPVPCGILPRELSFLVKNLMNEYSIIGIDINEYNPLIDQSEIGLNYVRSLIDFIFHYWS